MTKPTMWFPHRSDTNPVVQEAGNLEELYYLCSENKGVNSFAVTSKLICVFVFAYAKCLFSNDASQITFL